MVIHRLTDKIPVRIGEITFWMSPISWEDRTRLLSFTKMVSGQEVTDAMKMAAETIRCSLKDIEGVEYADETPYELTFDSNHRLSDECLAELWQLENIDKLIKACSALLYGQTSDLKDQGIEIDYSAVKASKKNKVAIAASS